MATLYEKNITGDIGQGNIYGVNWDGQTFTPSIGHTITSVKLKLWRVLSPGTITVSIRATSGSLPTGANLCSGTTVGDTLPTTDASEWREITLAPEVRLATSTEYAICVRALSGDSSNYLNWRRDTDNRYADGQRTFSSDSGSSWNAVGHDFMFEEWGDPTTLEVTTQPVTAITDTTATGNGTLVSLGLTTVTQHGVCWATTIDPTTGDNYVDNGEGSLGAFTSSIQNLLAGQQYFVRTYAINTGGTVYGNNVTFRAGFISTQLIAGNLAVVQGRLQYIDASGVERYITGAAV